MGSQIISSVNLFVDFLKAVKAGGADQKFATALASAGIIVLDFVANYLLAKLGSALAKFAAKLKGIAQRLMKKGKAAKGKGRAKAKGGRKAGARKPTGPRRRPVRGKRAAGLAKPKPSARKSSTERKRQREQERAQRRRADLQRAQRELPPKIRPLLKRGVSKLRLRAQLLAWRMQYRLRKLVLSGARVIAANSPDVLIVEGHELTGEDVRFILNFIRGISMRLTKRFESVNETPRGSVPKPGSPLPTFTEFFLKRNQPSPGTRTEFPLHEGFTGKESIPNFPRLSQTGTIRIEDAGRFDPEVADLFRTDPKGIAAAMQALARGRKPQLTGALKGLENKLTGTALLMFGLEPARNMSSLATSAMVTELIRMGMPPEEAVKAYPMAPKGAMRANVLIEKFRRGERTLSQFQEGKKPRQMIETEVNLLVKFVKMMLGQDLFEGSVSVQNRLAELEPDIETRLQKFFFASKVL